ncbi:hypothetical protein DOTSEDRAFT_29390 [Dothistroma septosporum NZE10]|uniref:F-box domain-containing protein n=1 Tax=Dothistroma septosporum (strain NZE10 / CBS 128990) TaxID=675120 RepID=N1PDP7_DOTSN|nr:hypothetical protein DOTSEDRAFT_29390 [Dothistroma septosporum NZE10]
MRSPKSNCSFHKKDLSFSHMQHNQLIPTSRISKDKFTATSEIWEMAVSPDLDSAVLDDSRNIFPFFDLPRELRDNIYDHLLITRRRTAEEHYLALKIDNLTDPTASRVSKQFRSEYLARACKHPIITQFIEHVDFYGDICEDTFPAPISRSQIAEFLLLEGSTEGIMHPDWIEELLTRLPKVTEVRVKIATLCSTVQEFEEGYDEEDGWLDIENLACFELYHSSERDYREFDFDKHAKDHLVKKWDFENKRWEYVKDKKLRYVSLSYVVDLANERAQVNG